MDDGLGGAGDGLTRRQHDGREISSMRADPGRSRSAKPFGPRWSSSATVSHSSGPIALEVLPAHRAPCGHRRHHRVACSTVVGGRQLTLRAEFGAGRGDRPAGAALRSALREGGSMSHLPVGPVHHMRFTVTDVQRSIAFYTELLGFHVAVDAPPPPEDAGHDAIEESLQGGVILMHEGMFIGLRPVDEERAADRFDPLRVGLDHISFQVPTRADLDAAIKVLDERGVEHGPIRELAPLGLCFLAFFDPDGIALELSAPIAGPA
jgi:glyoxylase I family protein